MRRCLLTLVTLVALAVPVAAAAATITAGASANGQQRTLHRGDTRVARLATNPSTGYSWLLAAPGKPALELVRRTTLTSPHALPGAPATLSLRFRVVAAGKATLRLVYRRPWETRKPPAKTFGSASSRRRRRNGQPAQSASRWCARTGLRHPR